MNAPAVSVKTCSQAFSTRSRAFGIGPSAETAIHTTTPSVTRFYDLSAAVQALPIPTAGPATEAPALAATGTEGRAEKSGLQSGLRSATTADFGGQPRTESTIKEGEGNRGKHQKASTIPVFSTIGETSIREYPQGDSNPCLSRERAMS